MSFYHAPENELSIDEARARGFVVDYPAHPRGLGYPVGSGVYGDGPSTPRKFDRFYIDRACPFAGWLVEDGVNGTGTPAFMVGKTREDAIRYTRRG